ncbi:MAG TPA: amino acid adenylation domain-containing protein, partial [Aquella sp.]|nr:amino acid adenylation domain-containing protein [Aquella sp.]
QLANYLRKTYAIKGDDLIALCLDRSEYMLIAILGVLKAGAAYVPIAPDYPKDRIDYILEDTKARVIITSCPTSIGDQDRDDIVIDSPEFTQLVEKYSKSNPKPNINSHNLAYIIYTSGTTGKPKGVALQHQGIVNRITWMNNKYPLLYSDRILQKTPYIFDVSVWELFWANWYGAAIVFSHSGRHKEIDYIIDLIEEKQITVIHFVPSMLDVFNQELLSQNSLTKRLTSLSYIFCSGEALQLRQIQEVHNLLPWAKLHNLYGPTEASVDVLSYDCSDNALDLVYIGKPISNTTAYILDNDLNPLPLGSIGELYIGGVGLARGYLNQTMLTKERFLINPFQTEAEKLSNTNARIYKTGDMVRYASDGNIEYIGRNDFQVKIRGLRIELGEIENILVSYSG